MAGVSMVAFGQQRKQGVKKMTSNLQFETYSLPDYWASALINGDDSGLHDQEKNELLAFTNWMIEKHGRCEAVTCADEGHFTKWHDATHLGVLACDAVEYTFLVKWR